jgi:hypothetical protein
MMVALTAGALVVAAVFTLGGASSRHFQEQQRIGTTQRSVRMAMDRLRRDIARAGYLGAPDTRSLRVCGQPTSRQVQAIAFTNDDATGNAALDGMRAANGVSADSLTLTGNFATAESYLVRSLSADGNQVFLQTNWLGFRRSFVTNGAVNTTQFASVFSPGNVLHLETPDGNHFFVDIESSIVNSTGTMATVTVSPGFGTNNPCIRGLGRGSIVSPISQIRYSIGPATAALTPRNATVTGPNTVLYRDVLNMQSGAVISRRPILEYAVDFNLDFVVDRNDNRGLPPQIVRMAGSAGATQTLLQSTPWQVRSVIASLAARTPEQDARFPWTYGAGRPATQPLNRFLVFSNRDGAARVRQLRTEVQLPNLIPRPQARP